MVVKFQVERRPISPSGKIYYGNGPGDYVSVLTNPTHLSLGGPSGLVTTVKPLGSGMSIKPSYVPAGQPVPALTQGTSGNDFSHVAEVSGEPWLVHSSHHSIDAALESAAPLSGAIGAENVRIIKVLSHSTSFKLN